MIPYGLISNKEEKDAEQMGISETSGVDGCGDGGGEDAAAQHHSETYSRPDRSGNAPVERGSLNYCSFSESIIQREGIYVRNESDDGRRR